jgi:tetratricopeptide (TPR) repeat protein
VPSQGYTAKEVASLLDLSVAQVRSFVSGGILSPAHSDGELRFSFQDVVLLRAAKELRHAKIPSRRIQRALHKLRGQLPAGRPLTGVAIGAEGNRIVVRDGGAKWNPESGQALFDFRVADLLRELDARRTIAPLRDPQKDVVDWFERACRIEADDPKAAIEIYRRVLALDIEHADSHINLGRLLHESGRVPEALAHYRWALAARPKDVTATFNLGVALGDLGRTGEAIDAYQATIALDPRHADSHYNLARLYEKLGRSRAAEIHLRAYEKLTEP